MKTNLVRIAQKIGEDKDPNSMFRLTDMVRATIIVDKMADFNQVYLSLKSMDGLQIVRIKNQLKGNL